jgi:cbb3-type cytochrome oxidase subunit 3
MQMNAHLDIVIWNLFVFWCLYFGIWHYFRRAGKPLWNYAKIALFLTDQTGRLSGQRLG